jgi:hypothetical protein
MLSGVVIDGRSGPLDDAPVPHGGERGGLKQLEVNPMSEHRDSNAERRETIVVKDGGSNTGVILGIIVLVVVLAGAWYLLMGPGAGEASMPGDLNINIELPTMEPADPS